MNLSIKPDVLFVILGASVAIAALWLMPMVQQATGAGVPGAQTDVADYWGTPFYLRYNVPALDSTTAYMPIPSNYAYALGVPSMPYTQKAVTV